MLLGTLYPLIRQALTGEPLSVGGPYLRPHLRAADGRLPAAGADRAPAGLEAGDLAGALQRLWVAAGVAFLVGVAGYLVLSPGKIVAAFGFHPRRLADRRRGGRGGGAGRAVHRLIA